MSDEHWLQQVLQEEELALAEWATAHESWAVVLWRRREPAMGLAPEVHGPYTSGAAALAVGERLRHVREGALLAPDMQARYGDLLVEVVPLDLDDEGQS